MRKKNVRLGAKLCTGIRFVDGNEEITTQVTNVIVAEGPSCWGLPLTSVREKQVADADLSIILDHLVDAVEPEKGVLFLAGPAANTYWLNKEHFTHIDEVLYRNRGHCDEKDLVAPKGLRAENIRLSLDLSTPSHQSVAQTKA